MELTPAASEDMDASLYGGECGSLDSSSMEQEDAIRAAIALSQPLVGPKEPFSALSLQYADNPKFLYKLQTGASVYSFVRRVRGDGNCFYRSLLFSVLEFALLPPPHVAPLEHFQLVDAFYTHFTASPTHMQTSGIYSDLIIDDFYDTTLALVDFATARTREQQGRTSLTEAGERRQRQALVAELEVRMNHEDVVQWYITWLRCLTSFQLQSHADVYSPYLVEHASIKAFCQAEVDGINREVDALQILALCTELQVAVHIEYLDNSDGPLKGYTIPEGKEPLVTVLYRPGHYDIIYTNDHHNNKLPDTAGVQAAATERKEATD